MNMEFASNGRGDRGTAYAATALRNATPRVISAVNRARRRLGLPLIAEIPVADLADHRGPGVYWDPQSPHRPRGAGLAVPAKGPGSPPAARSSSRGALITRVLILPTYLDAEGQHIGRSLPETIGRGAFGTAAQLNEARGWSLRADGHKGAILDHAGDRLRAIDSEHGLVIEWIPNLRYPWNTTVLRQIESGASAASVGMQVFERRISHLPRPTEMVLRARLDHVALLTNGGIAAYAAARAKVFRDCWSNDPAQLRKQIDELLAAARWHARQDGGY